MRARGLVILAFLSTISTLVACAASPGGQSFSDDKGGDDNGADSGWHPTQGGGGGGGGGVLLPDGGELLPDGAVITPPGDGGFLGDGSAPTTRISCGGSYCRGDQTCNAGSCQFACNGTNVPGDYATIQAAINANVGVADLTICLKAQNYAESVSVSTSPTTPKKLSIIGVSSSVTTINSLSMEFTPFSATTVRGVAFTQNVALTYVSTPVQFIGSKFSSASTTAFTDEACADVTLDGCDVASSGGSDAIYFEPLSTSSYASSTQKFTVQNSYIHDTNAGILLAVGTYNSGTPTLPVNIINDTFVNNGTALTTTGNAFPLSLTYANDLFVNNKTYGIDQECTNETVTTKDNALFGNANNYAGSAVDGPGYVKADVKLDSTQNPPGLSSGSPARGTADPSMAPATDFWGVERSSTPDIGAVQN